MTIEIVDFPIENGGSFHSYVSLPEGIYPSIQNANKLPFIFAVHVDFSGWSGFACLNQKMQKLPSGYDLPVCHGKILTIFDRYNHLFLCAMASMAYVTYTRGYLSSTQKSA